LTELLQRETLDFYGGAWTMKQPGDRADIDIDKHTIRAKEEMRLREPWTWVWGGATIIGNERAQSFIERVDDRFSSVIADDVLLGMYLQPFNKEVGVLYVWDETKNDEENVEQCRKRTPTFVRLKHASEASRAFLFDKFMM
jgi:hypothetical protein